MTVTVPARTLEPDVRKRWVGRARELAVSQGAFNRMLLGRRQILTIAGEPGIGKTRLAEMLGETAEDQGALVIWGRCYEEAGAPPYWPWILILREFVAASSPSELKILAAGLATDHILTLVPELGAALGKQGSPDTAPYDPGESRFLTFDAIGRFLRRAAEQVPLVLIIDNLHWADKASLALIEFLSQDLPASRLLLICTYRDTEVTRSTPLLETLGELCRGTDVERLRLSGLDSLEIAELAHQMLGQKLPDAVVRAIDDQTDGNPLFVIELLRALLEESRDGGTEPISVQVPEGVREIIGHRLSRLRADVNDLLRLASVLGRHFEVSVLTQIADLGTDTVLHGMYLAESAGFVENTEDSLHGYRFSHALIRETLYDEIPTPDRLRLHGLAGEALAGQGAAQEQQHLSRIAHHYYEAAALGYAVKAADYAFRAGQAAMTVDAYEEAETQFGHFLGVLKQYHLSEDERVRQATLLMADAMAGMGRLKDAVKLFTDPIITSSSTEDTVWLADMLAELAILTSHSVQKEQLPLLYKVMQSLPDGDSPARAKILATVAFAERTLGKTSRIRKLVEESNAIARRLGDSRLRSHCLQTSILALRGDPQTLDIRLDFSAEHLHIAPGGNNSCHEAEGSYLRALSLVEAGRIEECEKLLGEYRQYKITTFGLHEYRAEALNIQIRLLHGDYHGLTERIGHLREIGQKTRGDDAEGIYGAQMFALNRDLGELPALAPVIERFASSPANRVWKPGLLVALTEAGKAAAAQQELDELAEDSFAAIPRDEMYATALVFCTEACAALEDKNKAKILYDLLLPYSGTFVTHPLAVSFGAADLYLGILAGTQGEYATAGDFFESAIQENAEARAWPWLARSYFHFGINLRQQNGKADQFRAAQLLGEAESIASRLGMKGLVKAVNRELRGDDVGREYPDALTPREVDVLRLIAIGRSNKDIAMVLSISLNTVATHVRNILTKTDCANRTEAAAYASRQNLIKTH